VTPLRDGGEQISLLVQLAALNDQPACPAHPPAPSHPLAAVKHPQHPAVEAQPAGSLSPEGARCRSRRSPSSRARS
jgi:hypothetical protein